MPDDDHRKTWKGLRADDEDCPTLNVSDSHELARDTDARAAAREVAKWQALFDSGLVDLETVPVLQVARDKLGWGKRDELEVHVLLRVQGGATIAEIQRESPHGAQAVIGALCRLASHGIVRFS